MPTLRLPEQLFDNLLIADRIDTWQWVCDHVVLREGDRSYPYNPVDYPYHQGIMERADDPRIQELVFVAGTQVGKSTLARSWFVSRIASDPANGIFASSTEKLARNTARDELWPMFRECSATRPWCPASEKLQATDTMRLSNAKIRIAWSGSPTTLGDWTARWGLAGELDKWTRESSDEADPFQLFLKRFGAVNDYQWFAEGTPTFEETSRLWRLLLSGSNERLHVPCPRCGGYQELQLGNGKPKTGGIVWDRDADGKHDPLLALRTARYRCALCFKEWGDEYRMPAVRAGVWVPEGCRVTSSGKLRGEPLRPWPRASFQISRLYSPRTTWGKLARERVECGDDPELLRDYHNSTLGRAWRQRRQKARWEDVAARLCGGHELGTCPPGSIFVTAGVDVQLNHLVYIVSAWGLQATGWCIGLGIAESFDEFRRLVLDVEFPHADGGPPLPVEMTLMDSRYREDEVYEFCESLSRVGRNVWPYRGARAGQLVGRPYRRISPVDKDAAGRLAKSTRHDAFYAVTGQTNYWQSWTDKVLYSRRPGDTSSYTFHATAITDEDLFEQLTNEYLDETADPPQWIPATASAKRDLRDALRYSRTAAEVNLLGAWSRLAPRRIAAAHRPPPPDKPATAAGKEWKIRTPPPIRRVKR